MPRAPLDKLPPNVARLLNILAWLAPEPIPLFLFDSVEVKTLGSLTEFVSMTSPQDCVTLDPIVQKCVRAQQSTPLTWLTAALQLLNVARPIYYSNNVRCLWEQIYPHIAFATAEADRRGIAEPTSELMAALATWFASTSLHMEAEPLQRRALAIDMGNFGPYSTRASLHLSNLAQTLLATSRPFEAELLMRRALAIEQCYGPDNPRIADRLSDLSKFLRGTNRLEENASLMRQAIECRQAISQSTGDEDRQMSMLSSPPFSVRGIPRSGRILFATRCVMRIGWAQDGLPDIGDAVAMLVSKALVALQLVNRASPISRFPSRSKLHRALCTCVQRARAASRRMEFDLTVKIDCVVKFLTALDHALGTARAKDQQTSIRFAELAASETAISDVHRKAQQMDLDRLRCATEREGWTEASPIDAEILGTLWP